MLPFALPALSGTVVARVLAVALVALALLAFGYIKGLAAGMERFNDYVAAQAREAVKIVVRQGEATERVVTRYVRTKAQAEVIVRTVEKEVIRYAEENPGACLTARWGWLHDAAAARAVPEPAPRADAAARAPEAAAALIAISENYAACHRTADRLEALQEWVSAQRAAMKEIP